MISSKLHIIRMIMLGLTMAGTMIGFAQEGGTDAEYLKLVKEYVLHEDGSYDYHFRKEIRLNTYFSFHRLYGETFIVYNPEYQDLTINESYTVMADGKKLSAPENAFNEVLPRVAVDAADFNHLREMVVTHTGLERGAVVTLDYTIHSRPGLMPYLMGNEVIGEEMPVNELDIIVRIPNDARLQYEAMNTRTIPEILTVGNQISYIWSFRGLEGLSMESYQVSDRLPQLIFSTAKDLQWAFFTFINQPAFRQSVGPAIAKRTEEVAASRTDELDIMLALQDVVVDELRLAEIPMSFNGYRVRTADEAWQSAYATPMEKAILLAGMLEKANIHAVPVAIVSGGTFSSKIGSLSFFDKVMVQVNSKKYDRIYLSVTGKNKQNEQYSLKDQVVVVLDGAIESLKSYEEKPVEDQLSLAGKLNLEDTTILTGSLELVASGSRNPSLRIKRDPNVAKDLVSGCISSVSTTSYTIEKQTLLSTEATLQVKNDNAASRKRDYIILDLPYFRDGFHAWSASNFSEQRETALRGPGILSESYTLEVSVPENFELVSPQNLIEIENSTGRLYFRIGQKNGRLLIDKNLKILVDIVEPDDYQGFLDLLQTWDTAYLQQLVFVIRP